MKNYLIYFIFFVFNISLAQAPPPPPPPKANAKKDLIYGDLSKKERENDKKNPIKIVEVESNNQSNKGEIAEISAQNFDISVSESTDVNSIYYYKNVENLLQKLDTTAITSAQIISFTRYKIYSKEINPTYLDSLALKTYKLNEEKKYDEAIVLAKEILKQSPNNITGHKEISLAYRNLGNSELAHLHLMMMIKIINSVLKYGTGVRMSPYILNNFFEGISIYEAKYGLYPQKTRLILTKEKVLLAGYDSYHIMRFANLTHWLPSLKEGDYKIELN